MKIISILNILIGVAFFACYAYQFVFMIIALTKKSKPHKAVSSHRFAVLIAARNEERVIGGLIDSVHGQDYSGAPVDVYVVADNCTDKTADVARERGAVVFERCSSRTGKGYALEFLLQEINASGSLDKYDAFIVFDADNLLKEDFITELNKTYSDGYEIITCCRNSKNYGSNWISAGHSLWFLKDSKLLNYPRMLSDTSCVVAGTGFMFSNKVMKHYGGWPFHSLTEDTEFTAQAILDGFRIGYCADAEFYDEQPEKFSQSWRQRKRWARGYIQLLRRKGRRLFTGMFGKNGFGCFDLIMSITPAMVLSIFSVALNLTALTLGLIAKADVSDVLYSALTAAVNTWLLLFIFGAVTTVSERRRIHCTPSRKVLYAFTFPLFVMTYFPIAVSALFGRVT